MRSHIENDMSDLPDWLKEDKTPEWVGMPEFVQTKKKPFKEVIVRFETEHDYLDFQKRIGQEMTNKTKSIWHPFKSHWGLDRKVYKDAS